LAHRRPVAGTPDPIPRLDGATSGRGECDVPGKHAATGRAGVAESEFQNAVLPGRDVCRYHLPREGTSSRSRDVQHTPLARGQLAGNGGEPAEHAARRADVCKGEPLHAAPRRGCELGAGDAQLACSAGCGRRRTSRRCHPGRWCVGRGRRVDPRHHATVFHCALLGSAGRHDHRCGEEGSGHAGHRPTVRGPGRTPVSLA